VNPTPTCREREGTMVLLIFPLNPTPTCREREGIMLLLIFQLKRFKNFLAGENEPRSRIESSFH